MASGLNRVRNPERLPGQECFRGTLIHSRDYRNTDRFLDQRVPVVGAGNTGAEIALDLAEHGARPTMALRSPVNIVPRDFLGMPTQLTSIRIRRLPLKLGDAVARLVSRLAFGNLARYGLARPALGPLTAFKLHRRVPLIDVGTIAAVKRGDIAVKPAVARLTETGALFADGGADEFDGVVLATGYRPALEDIVAPECWTTKATRATGRAARFPACSSSATSSPRRDCCARSRFRWGFTPTWRYSSQASRWRSSRCGERCLGGCQPDESFQVNALAGCARWALAMFRG
jgi:cation diffusion facilitator CzcD-associated flavoprotein CzcO